MSWPEAFLYAVLAGLGSCCVLPVLAYFAVMLFAFIASSRSEGRPKE